MISNYNGGARGIIMSWGHYNGARGVRVLWGHNNDAGRLNSAKLPLNIITTTDSEMNYQQH